MAVKNLQDLQTYDEEKMAKQIIFNEPKSKAIAFNFLPGQAMPQHGHPHKNAFVFVIEGEGICSLDHIDSAIQQGDAIHCNPQQKISIKNTGAASMTVYVVLSEE
ncbi:quercetin dioxygenase-like cupin family protein [Planomicrobium koreense]|uniref:Quercetin dioxygenase-like cupin family protein n=1 Tax=Planococcus koreensis TaxID=112331 RepID=A0A7W8CWM5_9BACL|nr:cupin domain-containing protein [Planococcus koreensis]MBB5181592.1 quercetin dioxygenase-like cupin family protein [Planococcus koreensis]